jgi:hypothetical protein
MSDKMKIFYKLVEKAKKIQQLSELRPIDFSWNDTYAIVLPEYHNSQLVYLRE